MGEKYETKAVDADRRRLLTNVSALSGVAAVGGFFGGLAEGKICKTAEGVNEELLFDSRIAKTMEEYGPSFPALLQNASLPASAGGNASRLETVQSIVNAHPYLPEKIKKLFPFLPFLLSGYDPMALISEENRGLWQFSRHMGKNLGLMEKNRDDRADIRVSTEKALERLKAILEQTMSTSIYGKIVTHLDPSEQEDFLTAVVLSSFPENGERYVGVALERMESELEPNKKYSAKELIFKMSVSCSKVNLWEEDPDDYQQRIAAIPFVLKALARLDRKKKTPEGVQTWVRRFMHIFSGGVAGWGSSFLVDNPSLSRRNFLRSSVSIGVGALAGGLGGELLLDHFTPPPLPVTHISVKI